MVSPASAPASTGSGVQRAPWTHDSGSVASSSSMGSSRASMRQRRVGGIGVGAGTTKVHMVAFDGCWCGCEKPFDCTCEWKIGEPSVLTITSEQETRDSASTILAAEVTRLLEGSIR
jgi:hypothetical protein